MLPGKIKQGKAGRLTGEEGGAYLDKVVREESFKEMAFEKRSNRGKGVSHVEIWEEYLPLRQGKKQVLTPQDFVV